LSLPYKLSQEFFDDNSLKVTLKRIGWNNTQKMINKWNKTYSMFFNDENESFGYDTIQAA